MFMTSFSRTTILSVIAVIISLAAARQARAEDNTGTIISGVVSNHGNATFYVGNTGTNNALTIANSGVLTNVGLGYVGYAAGASNNTALITDPGSAWFLKNHLAIGFEGSGNSLAISNGGRVVNNLGYIGTFASASNNAVLVTGAGSVWSNQGALYVGLNAAGNLLVIAEGGAVANAVGQVGAGLSSSNNLVVVTGAGSVWNNGSDLYVGESGSANGLIISHGGQVADATGVLGHLTGSDNNFAVVTGAGSVWTNRNDLLVGCYGAGNQLTIADSGAVLNNNGYVGYDGTSSDNAVLVSGSGARWQNTGLLWVGYYGSGNSLVISNGGQVSDSHGYVGAFVNASNNSVLVSGSGSVWQNSGNIYVGENGAHNSLTIRDGGLVTNGVGLIGNNSSADGNTVTVTDPGSLWYNNAYLRLGSYGANNTLIISNGATVRNTMALVGLYAGADNNTVIVDGAGSYWVMDDIDFGDLSYGNQLYIRNGGVVSNQDVYVANSGGGNNLVVVDGAGSHWVTDALEFGESGGGNTLIITNQGLVSSREQGYVGYRGHGNTAIVTGTGSVWSNSSRLYVGNYQASSNQLLIAEGGAVYARSETYVGASDSSWNNSVWVTGTGSVWSNGQLSVGSRGSGNSIFVGVGSTLISGWSYIGDYASSSNNSALISGGLWHNNSALLVGNDGGNNSLVISNAGLVQTTGNAYLANSVSSSNNTVLISGSCSTWDVGGQLLAGRNGGNNRLSVIEGGTLRAASLELNHATLQVAPASFVHVTGSYTQTVNGVLELGIGGTNAGEYAALQVDNRALLDGTLSLVPVGVYTPGTNDSQRIIETSGGVTGTFATVQSALGGTLTPKLDYSDGYNVWLNWVLASFQPYALTPNQLATAVNLDNAADDPAAGDLLTFLGSLPTNDIPAALELVAPAEFGALFQAGFAGMLGRGHAFLGRVNELRAGGRGFNANRLSLAGLDCPLVTGSASLGDGLLANICRPDPANPWGLYLEGLGENIDVDSDAATSGYDLTSAGFKLGLDRRLNDHLVIGLAAGYDNAEADLDTGGEVDIDRGHGSLYAVWLAENFHLEALVGGAFNDYQTRRAALGGSARGDTDGTEFHALVGGGWDRQRGDWTFGPWAVLQYQQVELESFTETGSLAPLSIPSQSAESLSSQIGLEVAWRSECGRIQLAPNLRLAWQHEYLDDNVAVDAALANGAGGTFTVEGPSLGRDSLVLGVGLGIQWTETIGSWLQYTTELGRDNYQPHTINAGIQVSF